MDKAYIRLDVQPCNLDDVKNNNLGNCVNGEVSGKKIDGNIEQCSCVCNNGYEFNPDVNINRLANSCMISEDINNYLCFNTCSNTLETLSGNDTEYCNAVENMLDLCGRKCTLEGGGTLRTNAIIKKTHTDLMLELQTNGKCSFSSNSIVDIYIGNDFLKLIYYCLLFNLPDYKYDNVSKLSNEDRHAIFGNEPNKLIDIKNKLSQENKHRMR